MYSKKTKENKRENMRHIRSIYIMCPFTKNSGKKYIKYMNYTNDRITSPSTEGMHKCSGW